jgi:hypothetical protein
VASIKGKTNKFNSGVFIAIPFNIHFFNKARLKSKSIKYFHFIILSTQIKVLNALAP